ncbi:hypothetical protein AALP_AA2G202500 [Arabis alpina]|uniref:Uncharacterized protein n=1 Tax=Arabis alpina TaxID=50452 RepID=A0A087HIS4_ARAAL|nr:hypothetical protein AALP_AA2G202500 [Arabis alpina]
MQETKENSSRNVSTVLALTSHQPIASHPGVWGYYQQLLHDSFNVLQGQTTMDLCNQLTIVKERLALCVKERDNFVEVAVRKNREMEMRMNKAIAEAKFWKKSSDEKVDLCHELASRLRILKKGELKKRKVSDRKFADEAESSTGDNGDDDVDTANTRMCKRRRL